MSYDLLRLSLLFRRFVHATERSKIAFSCASASRPPSPPPAHSNPPCLARRAAAAAAAATRLDSSGRASLARRAALDSLDLRSSRDFFLSFGRSRLERIKDSATGWAYSHSLGLGVPGDETSQESPSLHSKGTEYRFDRSTNSSKKTSALVAQPKRNDKQY